mmetsp:Transcript_15282/g.18604  ORF Transcript_15282/g.18604 Transcript_15282/m.18604 type:complete len:388 (-) Transcript_15282:239-1402(-)
MGNTNVPPSNGNSRDDPRGVGGHNKQAYGTHPQGGQHPTHTHQHPGSRQHQQNPYSGGGNVTGNPMNGMRESISDASMSNVEDNPHHRNQSSSGSSHGGVTGGATGTGGGAGGGPMNQTPGGTSSSSDAGNAAAGSAAANQQLNFANLTTAEDDTVPTVFRWEHGGRQVYITGTFNGWSRQIPMHRSGNDFTYIHNLKRGKHAFKFIVDDEWRFAPDQPTVADIEGRINNFIDVTDFKAYTGDKDFEREKVAAYYAQSRADTTSSHQDGSDAVSNNSEGNDKDGASTTPTTTSTGFTDPDGEVFTHNMPDLDEYTKDPPPLPPHLRHIILNKPPQLTDTAALPVPQHVALNHLYCTAIKDNMMVLGVTQRFKTKFVTTVYYSPELSK